MTYTCPMHPEVVQDGPGRCPSCGMRLVESHGAAHPPVAEEDADYGPLLTILFVLALATAVVTVRDVLGGGFDARSTVSTFMAGFFLAFATTKLLDLPGFADGFGAYDLLAAKALPYGYVYPFLELAFGLAMLVRFEPAWLLWTEVAFMLFGSLGVALRLRKGKQFRCACLGTVLKVPLSWVTLAEYLGMAAMAGYLLVA